MKDSIDILRTLMDGEIDSELYEAVRVLSPAYRAVLWAKLSETGTGDNLRPVDIARLADVNPATVWRAMNDTNFQKALTLCNMSMLRGDITLAFIGLRKKVREGHLGAIKYMMEITGVYCPIQRIESRSLHLRGDVDVLDLRGKPAEAVREEVVREWRRMGWKREDFERLWDEALK